MQIEGGTINALLLPDEKQFCLYHPFSASCKNLKGKFCINGSLTSCLQVRSTIEIVRTHSLLILVELK